MQNKFIQYELWKDCSNHCSFCYNYGQEDNMTKLKSLEFFKNKLLEKEVDDYNEIGFIGGEFFDNQLDDMQVKKAFYELFDICSQKRRAGKLNKLYVATALMYDGKKHLVPFLRYLKKIGLLNITMICTSYDLKYRFNKPHSKEQWEENMRVLNSLFPSLTLHTEIIMTEFFMKAVLNDEFSITNFHKKYNTWIDYVHPQRWSSKLTKEQCHKILPDFFATKHTFTEFLKKVTQNNEINLDTFLSMNVRSDAFYCMYNGEQVDVHDRRKLLESDKEYIDEYCKDKQHLHTYLTEKNETGFIDSDLQMIDVVKQFKQIYGE